MTEDGEIMDLYHFYNRMIYHLYIDAHTKSIVRIDPQLIPDSASDSDEPTEPDYSQLLITWMNTDGRVFVDVKDTGDVYRTFKANPERFERLDPSEARKLVSDYMQNRIDYFIDGTC